MRFAQERVAARTSAVLQRLYVQKGQGEDAQAENSSAAIASSVPAGELRDKVITSVTQMSHRAGGGDDPGVISVMFSVTVEETDGQAALAMLEALLALYVETDVDVEASSVAGNLEAITMDVEQRAGDIQRLRETVAQYAREHPVVLAETPATENRGAALAQSELAQLDIQIERLQERSATVANALQQIDPRGALVGQIREPAPATSQRLTALQTVHAMLRGRYGSNHSDVQRLAAETAAVRAELESAADQANRELTAAQAEYARLQRQHSLDFPDVVRMANTVSSLENAVDASNTVGLSRGEADYIENLAREEQSLQKQLADLRLERDAVDRQVAQLRARAVQAPVLMQAYQALRDELGAAEARHEVAVTAQRELEQEYNILLQRGAPAVLSSRPPYGPNQLIHTRVETILAAGALLGLLLAALVVLAMERIDRRVRGAQSITAIHGQLPLAEIPMIPNYSLAAAG